MRRAGWPSCVAGWAREEGRGRRREETRSLPRAHRSKKPEEAWCTMSLGFREGERRGQERKEKTGEGKEERRGKGRRGEESRAEEERGEQRRAEEEGRAYSFKSEDSSKICWAERSSPSTAVSSC